MTVTLEKMPEIWLKGSFIVSREHVLGELANHAVRQSPYCVPDGLVEALTEFDAIFPNDAYFEATCGNLNLAVRTAFEGCPHIIQWNSPKVSNHGIVFCSRFHRPNPDYDIIDLDALARNIAHSVTLSNKYDNAHD